MPAKNKTPPANEAGHGSEKSEPKKPKTQKTERPAIIPKDPAPRQLPPPGTKTFKAVSWNVAGLRSLMDKNPGLLRKIVDEEQPDVFSLQEHKLQEQHVAELTEKLTKLLPEYPTIKFAVSTAKKGYSGVCVLAKARLPDSGSPRDSQDTTNASPAKKSIQPSAASFFGGSGTKKEDEEEEEEEKKKASPAANKNYSGPSLLAVSEGLGEFGGGYLDEGRVLTMEFEEFFLTFAYVPNSGAKLERLPYRLKTWDADFRDYLAFLDTKKPVVMGGDLNVAHLDVDIYNVESPHVVKSAGTTPEERQSFAQTLQSLDFVDTFRKQHPHVTGWYTQWSQRAGNRPKNRGLRLDYFICSKRLDVVDGFICEQTAPWASDHAPLGVTLRL